MLDCLPDSLRFEVLEILKTRNKKLAIFPDEFNEETSGRELIAVKEWLEKMHSDGQFILLNEEKMNETKQFKDLQLIGWKAPDWLKCETQEERTDAAELYRAGKATRGRLTVGMDQEGGEVLGRGIRVGIKYTGRAIHGDEVYAADEKVIGIVRRRRGVIVGSVYQIEERNEEQTRIVRIRPIERRIPDVVAMTGVEGQVTLMEGTKVVVHVTGWESGERLPRGVICDVIGESGKWEDEVKAALIHYGVDFYGEEWDELLGGLEIQEMKERMRDDLNRAYEEIKEGKRVDLRGESLFSIDPPGCTDIDDALHISKRNGKIEVGVHIADVAYYVIEGSELDAIARHRSTTLYLPGSRIDMLPSFLSSDLASLRAGQDRLCISCVWQIGADHSVGEPRIFRSMIRSRAALTYEQAAEMAESGDGPFTEELRALLQISAELKARRLAAGALNLVRAGDSPHPTHSLVEEFMLLANIAVARFIYKHNPEYSLLRRHPLPASFDLGLPADSIDCSSSSSISASLAKLEPSQAHIASRIIARSMQQAIYFVSGESNDFFHYGLATPIYTHFTSPIRRFPDLVVHRTLAAILDGHSTDWLSNSVTATACEWMNYRHRNGQLISRWLAGLHFSLPDTPVVGNVILVKEHGCVIYVPEYEIEEFVPTSVRYKLFDQVRIVINYDFKQYCITRKIIMHIEE